MDWVDPALSRRSMELMATEVMPRITALPRRYDPGMSTEALALPPRAPTQAQMARSRCSP